MKRLSAFSNGRVVSISTTPLVFAFASNHKRGPVR